jgi:molecular chaperone GrpE
MLICKKTEDIDCQAVSGGTMQHKKHKPYADSNQPDDMDEDILFFQDGQQEQDDAQNAAAAEDTAREDLTENAEPLFGARNEIQKLEERYQSEMTELRLRAAAEMDNFKKRLTREHEEKMRFAAEKVLGDLLPTLDNFDLALQYGSRDAACQDMLQGLARTRQLMLDAIAKHGLVPVGGEGQPFDPTIHEAIGFEQNMDYAPNSIARVLQNGYTLNGRLLRPAKVMVTPS